MHPLKRCCKDRKLLWIPLSLRPQANWNPRLLGTALGSAAGMLDKDSSCKIISRLRARFPYKNYLSIVIYFGENEFTNSDFSLAVNPHNKLPLLFSTIWEIFFPTWSFKASSPYPIHFNLRNKPYTSHWEDFKM